MQKISETGIENSSGKRREAGGPADTRDGRLYAADHPQGCSTVSRGVRRPLREVGCRAG